MKSDVFALTQEEYDDIICRYFDETQKVLTVFPSKEKRKVAVLLKIITFFECETAYNEQQINQIIKPIYADFSTIRRYLVDYKLLERSKDGKVYKRLS